MPGTASPSYTLPGRDEFLRKYSIPEDEFQKTGLNWNDLELMFHDYVGWWKPLPEVGEEIAAILRKCHDVHAVKSRAKHPEKLVEKVIRRSIEIGSCWASSSNYVKVFPDLIGVRILYLFHEQWRSVNKFIKTSLPIVSSTSPVAYIQKPTPKRLYVAFTSAGVKVEEGKHGYQSVHYEMCQRVDTRDIRVEVQTRTLYEEAWGEVSHVTAYPYRKKVALLVEQMDELAKMTARADHFSSIINMFTQLYDARQAGKTPSSALVDEFITRLKFLKTHYPDLAASLIAATSKFSIEQLDSSVGL